MNLQSLTAGDAVKRRACAALMFLRVVSLR